MAFIPLTYHTWCLSSTLVQGRQLMLWQLHGSCTSVAECEHVRLQEASRQAKQRATDKNQGGWADRVVDSVCSCLVFLNTVLRYGARVTALSILNMLYV